MLIEMTQYGIRNRLDVTFLVKGLVENCRKSDQTHWRRSIRDIERKIYFSNIRLYLKFYNTAVADCSSYLKYLKLNAIDRVLGLISFGTEIFLKRHLGWRVEGSELDNPGFIFKLLGLKESGNLSSGKSLRIFFVVSWFFWTRVNRYKILKDKIQSYSICKKIC